MRTERREFRVRSAVLAVLLATAACRDLPTKPHTSVDADSSAATWRTWVLAASSELRPTPPPASGSPAERAEVEQIVAAQARPATRDSALRWAASPTAPWDSVAMGLLDFYFPLLPHVRSATPARAARAMALVHVAMYDALVATWDAKYAYRRAAPSAVDPRVRLLVGAGPASSYPSEHAAAAAAAAGVLAYLFPREDTLALHAMARAAGEARIATGAAFPTDVTVGAALGRAVAARVVARAASDGASEPWTGALPVGEALWQPTPSKYVRLPFDANAGAWRTWVIPSGSALRPPPPPALTSTHYATDIAELRALSKSRTLRQTDIARYWATDAPSVIWEKYMFAEVARRQLSPLRAARAQALASVAMHDAFIACWDAKFHYWRARPITDDTALETVFPTPPFPSYPSGHSTISAAAAEVFAELFPDAATHYRAMADQASNSRVFAAVHFRFDVESGDTLGARVGRLVAERARRDALTQ